MVGCDAKYVCYMNKLGIARSESGGTRWRTGGEVEGKQANGVGSQYNSTLPRNEVWPALLSLLLLICTPRLSVVDWTDAPTDLNGLVRFGKDDFWFLRVCHHVPHELYQALRIHTECGPDVSKSHFLHNPPPSASVGLSPGLQLLQNCTYCRKRIRLCVSAKWRTVPVVGKFTFGTAPWLKVEKGKCHWKNIVWLREEHSTPVTNVHKTRNGVFYTEQRIL